MSSVTVSLTFPSLEEAITGLAKLRTADTAAVAPVAPPPKPDKPAKTEKAAPTPPSATTAAAPASPPSESAIPYETVVKAISAAAAKDKPKAVATLKSFGASNGKELKAEQYADFLAALEKAMAPEEESLT
jgi:hypothetical protein